MPMNWDGFRAQFPVTERWAFMDHAAVAPLPGPAVSALNEYADDIARNGIASVGRWVHRVKAVRELAARLLNADADEMAFVKNTSEGISWVAEGFPWKPGDNVVLAAEEYPSNQYPWMNQAHRGVEVRSVPSRGSRIAIDDIRTAIDSRTRIVSLSFVEFASGFRNDLDAIGHLCHELGVYFFVDAIQGLGVYPLDVKTAPVDFLAADSHKWLLGPEGIGLFWIRRGLIDVLHPVGVGWNSVVDPNDFGKIDFRLKPNASRWEGGAPNVGGITAMGASIEMLLSVGIERVREKVEFVTDHLCERAPRAGLEVFSSRTSADKSGIVSLRSPGRDAGELMKRCRSAGIVVNNRMGRLRLSPHAYNTTDEIDRFIDCVR
jgi:cysteine desulfurase / selenocysteine lyase